jgi:hypothetical protein
MNKTPITPRLRRANPSSWLRFALAVCAFSFCLPGVPLAAEVEDSCVDCHSDKDFLVVNKKLYDYYQDWEFSVHKQEEVTCFDCHGGDPEIADKKGAHGIGLGEESASSAVNFKNIPDTCGQCHEEILDSYRESEHFKHLVRKKEEKQGPNCVTCHGSMGTSIPNVTSVEEACVRCHNDETENHPEIPEDARTILNKFLSIDRFYRYIRVRLEPEERGPFLDKIDVRLHDLSLRWHTFDLEEIEKDTQSLLAAIKEKRDEVRQRKRKAAAKSASGR